ncbi:MAG: class I SAM-dependent methyltransferase [Candidatus Pacearchaeota archaeon]
MKKEEIEAKNKYDLIAEFYHNFRTKENPKGWMYNEHLEMPATLKLIGNVRAKKVLDFGCGSGIYTKILKNKGAKIKGFDISESMLKIARDNLPDIEFKQGSGNKIPYNEKFDLVIASLVMDYFDDWSKPFKEVSRVLNSNGEFIFSIGNPISETSIKYEVDGKRVKYEGIPVRIFGDYFSERKIYGIWKNILHKNKVRDIKMPTYHKTYETVIKTILSNGFEIVDYIDCYPTKESQHLFPEEYKFLTRVPFFCSWKVKKK